MSLWQWDETYSVGVDEIDDQHQKLIGMINKLHDGLGQGVGSGVIGDILNEMADYTEYHFKTEEDYFEKFNFREMDIHVSEHKSFSNKVSEFNAKFENNPMILSVEVMYYLSNWLKNHIQGTDRNYTKLFNDNGLV